MEESGEDTIQMLKTVLKENLSKKGIINDIKSKLRAEIFNVLNSKNPPEKKKLNLSESQLLIHELIMDYFSWAGLSASLSVFKEETGNSQPMGTEILKDRLKLPNSKRYDYFSLFFSKKCDSHFIEKQQNQSCDI